MRNLIILAGLTVALAVPAAASAATRCQQDNRGNEVAGTVVGGLVGGLVGNAVSHGRSRSTGTAVGAIGGAVIGNRLAASGAQPCPDGYYAYEDSATSVDAYGRPVAAYEQEGQISAPYSYDRYGNRVYRYEGADPRYANNQAYSAPAYGQYGQYDRYSQSAPASSSYSYPTASYGGAAPTYSYGGQTAGSYGGQTGGSYGGQATGSYDRQTTGYGRTYASEVSETQASTMWQDSYGRTCHWRDTVDSYGSHSWVQSCRGR